MSWVPKVLPDRKAVALSWATAQEGSAPSGVFVHGRYEEDGPGTWETQTLAEEAEAVGEGDRSRGRWRLGVGESHRSEDAGERVTPDPAEQKGTRVGTSFRRETWPVQRHR